LFFLKQTFESSDRNTPKNKNQQQHGVEKEREERRETEHIFTRNHFRNRIKTKVFISIYFRSWSFDRKDRNECHCKEQETQS
jgi:hypothetical protein